MARFSWTAIGHDLGLLLHIPAAMAIPSLVLAIVKSEWFALPGFVLMALVSLGAGQGLYRYCRSGGSSVSPQAMIVVALGWLLIVLCGAVPFYLAAQLGSELSETTRAFNKPLNALFESMSGFTSTGLTMTQDASALPYSLQWWRSFSEWVGGVGVIVLALAIIDTSEKNYALYSAEARQQQLGDTAKETVRRIWAIFFAFTILAIAAFWMIGMSPWEAVNHGMTGIATGGFAVTSNSFQGYSLGIKTVAIIIMLMGAVSFHFYHHLLVQFNIRSAFRQSQLWTFLVMLVLGLSILMLINVVQDDAAAPIDRIFQWASAFGTCGFSSVQVKSWTQSALALLTVGMIIGGMGGSTSGGLKLSRVTWLAKALWWRLRNFWLHENETESYRYDGESLSEEKALRQVSSAAIMAFLWLITLAAGTLLLFSQVGDQYYLHQVLFEAASALGSVGLSAGITGTELTGAAKLTLMTLMWMGRLEILAVVVLLSSPIMAFRTH